ncbi:MAG: Rab family GTPase [Coleofasciculaceae cyanobacterium]
MIQKKVCMVGAFATGKTSLVSRFVHSMYSEIYQSTVGVKIDKKTLKLEDQEINLILWDIQGEDNFQKLRLSYLRGLSGYLLVVDGTRRATFEKALNIQQSIEQMFDKVPFILIINKSDLADEWEIDNTTVDELSNTGWNIIKGSAKTGLGVEEAFLTLTKKIMAK